jgi:hypothetical protein
MGPPRHRLETHWLTMKRERPTWAWLKTKDPNFKRRSFSGEGKKYTRRQAKSAGESSSTHRWISRRFVEHLSDGVIDHENSEDVLSRTVLVSLYHAGTPRP